MTVSNTTTHTDEVTISKAVEFIQHNKNHKIITSAWLDQSKIHARNIYKCFYLRYTFADGSICMLRRHAVKYLNEIGYHPEWRASA